MNILEEACGRVAPGMCRLSMGGGIAVRTKAGYRTYDPDTKRLVNCDSFVLDVGEDAFFVIPAQKVKAGDIILAGGTPRCVTGVQEDTITALNFEDAAVETLVPERHVFLGNAYMYGKIVSVFGRNGAKGKKGMGRMLKFMMLSGLLKGKADAGSGQLLAMMMLGGGGNEMDDLFGLSDGEGGPDEKEEA